MNGAAGEAMPQYGIVAIGRNEGERLHQCLLSVDRSDAPIVYVDSGSKDESVALATSLGARVVNLDMSIPFTAARARNAGFEALMEQQPQLQFVFFLDGDCIVDGSWLRKAQGFLEEHAEVVAVCGRRRERFPERSIYNLLCDLDWQGTFGETRSFGGDVMLRVDALRRVGGYNPTLIAGEEPELCIRLRRAGWRIWRINAPMTLHDANILHFRQWWRRSVRTGYAFAEGAWHYGAAPERHWVRETVSSTFWGSVLPLFSLAALPFSPAVALVLLSLYPLQALRLFLTSTLPARQAALWSVFLLIGKFAEFRGMLKFAYAHLRGANTRLIEYK